MKTKPSGKVRKQTASKPVISTKKKLAEILVRRKSRDGSMLNHIVNLACEEGHAHFSPTPMSWVGRPCGAKKPNGKRCQKRLFFIRSSREIPVPGPKKKPSRLNKIRRT